MRTDKRKHSWLHGEKDSKRQREYNCPAEDAEEYKAQLANCKSDLAKLEAEKVRIEDEVKKAEGEVLSLQGGGVMLREEVTTPAPAVVSR